MTQIILRSTVPADFAKQVEEHARELNAHAEHMALVAKKEAEPYPAPEAHPLIAASVLDLDGKFVPDFQLVDRIPVPRGNAAALEARKAELRTDLAQREIAAINAIVSPGRRKLAGIHQNDAYLRRGAALTRKNAAQESKDEQALAAVESDIAEADAEIARVSKINAAIVELQRKHAEVEIMIDDLSFDDINEFELPDVGGAK